MIKEDILKKLESYIKTIEFERGIPSLDFHIISEIDGNNFSSYFNAEIINNKTIYNVILESVTEVIASNKIKIGDLFQKIEDVNGLDINKIVTKTYFLIKHLPITYTFVFPLNSNTDGYIKNDVQLTNKIKLLFINKRYSKLYKESDLARLLFHPGEVDVQSGQLALTIKSLGFVSKFGIVKIYDEDPLYLFKIIIGVYLAMGVFNINDSYHRGATGYNGEYAYKIFDKYTHICTLHESTEDAHFLNSLILSPLISASNNSIKLTTFLDNFGVINKDLMKILTVEEFKEKRPKGLDPKVAENYMNIKAKIAEHGFQISNGAYWYYEALKSSQPHMQIVFLVTAFDSLLGIINEKIEKPDIVAYSIASNAIEVETIKRLLRNLYDLRNDIIHGKGALYKLLDNGKDVESEKLPFVLKLTCEAYLKRFLEKRITLYSKSISNDNVTQAD